MRVLHVLMASCQLYRTTGKCKLAKHFTDANILAISDSFSGHSPGFEEGIRTMRLGGTRRIVIPPELGPPVGPSTFFSAKQFEVFDVELLDVKDCTRRTIAFYSDVVCD